MKYEILKSNCRLVVLVYCCVDSYFELGINTITQQLREVNRLADYLYGVVMRQIKEQSWISNKHCFRRLDKLKVNITDLRLIFGIRRSTSSQKISKPPTSYFHCSRKSLLWKVRQTCTGIRTSVTSAAQRGFNSLVHSRWVANPQTHVQQTSSCHEFPSCCHRLCRPVIEQFRGAHCLLVMSTARLRAVEPSSRANILASQAGKSAPGYNQLGSQISRL